MKALTLSSMVLVALLVGAYGLSASHWRSEVEPLLPPGVTITSATTGNCQLEFNCRVSMRSQHDRERYAEDAELLHETLSESGWIRIGGRTTENSASGVYTHGNRTLSFRLRNAAWFADCSERYYADDPSCRSSIGIR
jgi:hypothetical protein